MRTISKPPALLALAAKQAGLVTNTQCDTHGLGSSTRTALVRRGEWIREARGVYQTRVPLPKANAWEAAHRRAKWLALLTGPADAIPVGLTALAVHEVWGLPLDLPPQVSFAGRHTSGPGGVRVRQFARPGEVVRVDGREVAAVPTALIQALPEVGRDLAVVLLDNCLNRKKLSSTELDEVRRGVRGRRGAARLHEVWPLVDGRAESPLETRARLRCIDADIPPDDLQRDIVDARGAFLGRGDLLWRRRKGGWILVEMDGLDEHEVPGAVYHDRHRQNGIARKADGVMLLRYTGVDSRSGRLVRELREAIHD